MPAPVQRWLQLLLNFDEPSHATGRPLFQPQPAPPTAHPEPNAAGTGTPPSAPTAPTAPLAPTDQRHIVLQGRRLAYRLQRSSRRSIGFSISPLGLVVTAPRAAAIATIERSLQEKSHWIITKLDETANRAQQQDLHRIDWQNLAPLQLPVLGASRTIPLPLPRPGMNAEGLARWRKTHASRWFMREAYALFPVRLNHFAPLMEVQWQGLRLSQARTRWGSASSQGVIMLNWHLLHFPMSVIDYVVVHELAHLRHMDHSPAFWRLVAQVLPDYRVRREQLHRTDLPQW